MDQRSTGLFLVMNQFQDGFKIDNLEDRVFLQKVVYLIQLLGVDFRFRFSWYLRGPYCRELNLLAFDIDAEKENLKTQTANLKIREVVKNRIDQLERVLGNKPTEMTNPQWFELVSSIHYLRWISSEKPEEITIDNIGEFLVKYGKSSFKAEQINAAWNQLEELGLISNKTLQLQN